MSLMDSFIEAVERIGQPESPQLTALATVASGYTGGPSASVRFDGETVFTSRTYKVVTKVSAGTRVVMLRHGPTWVILGPVDGLSFPDRMRGSDTRTVNDPTTTWNGQDMQMTGPEFKDGNAIGLSGGFFGVITITPWGDDSGGAVHQLAFGAGSYYHGVWRRIGSRSAGWGAWAPLGEDSGWVEFDASQFYGGWSKYQTGLASQWAPRWRRLNGIIYLEGLVQLGTYQTTNVHQLPAQARPAVHVMRTAQRSGGLTIRYDVSPSGLISMLEGSTSGGWHNIATSYIAA